MPVPAAGCDVILISDRCIPCLLNGKGLLASNKMFQSPRVKIHIKLVKRVVPVLD